MLKNHYQKELVLNGTLQKGANNNKKDVIRIQSWLMLHEMASPGSIPVIGIDGDFGPATMEAVKHFQRTVRLRQTGVVDQPAFRELVAPLRRAFQGKAAGNSLRELVVNSSFIHLANHPFELIIKNQANCGPWVRSYMDGNEGQTWWWCMGFVQAVLDQAFSALGRSFKEMLPHTYSCDTVGMSALNKGLLLRNVQVRKDPAQVKPGDIFLVQKTPFDWIHTGIITKVGTDVFETVEGNTNRAGSANGDRVYRRIRNFRQSKLDVVRMIK